MECGTPPDGIEMTSWLAIKRFQFQLPCFHEKKLGLFAFRLRSNVWVSYDEDPRGELWDLSWIKNRIVRVILYGGGSQRPSEENDLSFRSYETCQLVPSIYQKIQYFTTKKEGSWN